MPGSIHTKRVNAQHPSDGTRRGHKEAEEQVRGDADGGESRGGPNLANRDILKRNGLDQSARSSCKWRMPRRVGSGWYGGAAHLERHAKDEQADEAPRYQRQLERPQAQHEQPSHHLAERERAAEKQQYLSLIHI